MRSQSQTNPRLYRRFHDRSFSMMPAFLCQRDAALRHRPRGQPRQDTFARPGPASHQHPVVLAHRARQLAQQLSPGRRRVPATVSRSPSSASNSAGPMIWNQRHLMTVLREPEDFRNTHRPHHILK